MTTESINPNLNLRGVETVLQHTDNTFQYIYHFFIDLNPEAITLTSPIGPLQFAATYNQDNSKATSIQATYNANNSSNQIGLTANSVDVRTYYIGSCALSKGATLATNAKVSISQYPQPGSEGVTTVYGDPNSRRPPIIKLNATANLPSDLSQVNIGIGIQTDITSSNTPGTMTTHIHPDYFVIVVLQVPVGLETLYPGFQYSTTNSSGTLGTLACNPTGCTHCSQLSQVAVGVYDCNIDFTPNAGPGAKNNDEWPKLPATFVNTVAGTTSNVWWAQF